MDAPSRTPSSNIPSGPLVISRTASRSNRLHSLLTEAEGEIFKLKSNTYPAWIYYFYRFCLKDPLTFALVK